MDILKINRFKQLLGFVLLSIYLLSSSLNIYLIPKYNCSITNNSISVAKSYTKYSDCSNLNTIRLFDKSILDDDHLSSNKFAAKVILLIFGSIVFLYIGIGLILPKLYLFFNKQCDYLVFLCFRI